MKKYALRVITVNGRKLLELPQGFKPKSKEYYLVDDPLVGKRLFTAQQIKKAQKN